MFAILCMLFSLQVDRIQLKASDMPFCEPGMIMIKDGQLINCIKITRTEKARRLFCLLMYLPIIISEAVKTLRNVAYLVKINLKLLQE